MHCKISVSNKTLLTCMTSSQFNQYILPLHFKMAPPDYYYIYICAGVHVNPCHFRKHAGVPLTENCTEKCGAVSRTWKCMVPKHGQVLNKVQRPFSCKKLLHSSLFK